MTHGYIFYLCKKKLLNVESTFAIIEHFRIGNKLENLKTFIELITIILQTIMTCSVYFSDLYYLQMFFFNAGSLLFLYLKI